MFCWGEGGQCVVVRGTCRSEGCWMRGVGERCGCTENVATYLVRGKKVVVSEWR